MLITQAAEQFRLWTGQKAPLGVMREAAGSALAEMVGCVEWKQRQ